MKSTVFLTMPQLRIMLRAKLFFKDIPLGTKLRSMFREENGGLSVRLMYADGGQHHVVNATISSSWSDGEVVDALERIHSAMVMSIARLA